MNNIEFTQRLGENDIHFKMINNRVWVNLNDISRITNLAIEEWLKLSSTQNYISALKIDVINDDWAIDELAIDFARWCSPIIRVWLNKIIRDLFLAQAKSSDLIHEFYSPEYLEILELEEYIKHFVKESYDYINKPMELGYYTSFIDQLMSILKYKKHDYYQKSTDISCLDNDYYDYDQPIDYDEVLAEDTYVVYLNNVRFNERFTEVTINDLWIKVLGMTDEIDRLKEIKVVKSLKLLGWSRRGDTWFNLNNKVEFK